MAQKPPSSDLTYSEIMAREPLPQPLYDVMAHGIVMTDEQMATLKDQITVYRTCTQELFKIYCSAVATQTAGNFVSYTYDPTPHAAPALPLVKPRQRWSPQPAQLQLLEKYFSELSGTPHKAKLKDITMELAQHGPITDTNVYNWFQNRKARAKRKQSSGMNGNDKESENDKEDETGDGEEEEGGEKKPRIEGEEKEEEGEEHKEEGAEVEDGANGEQHLHQHSSQQSQSDVGASKVEKVVDMSVGQFRAAMYSHADAEKKVQVSINGKSWDVPVGLLDVKTSFGDASILIDSKGHVVATNETGVTLQPLEEGASYTLSRRESWPHHLDQPGQ